MITEIAQIQCYTAIAVAIIIGLGAIGTAVPMAPKPIMIATAIAV